jgi:hypothetical protein
VGKAKKNRAFMVRLDKQSSGPRSENFTPLLGALAVASAIFFKSSGTKHRYTPDLPR